MRAAEGVVDLLGEEKEEGMGKVMTPKPKVTRSPPSGDTGHDGHESDGWGW